MSLVPKVATNPVPSGAGQVGRHLWSLRWLIAADAFLLSPLVVSEVLLLRERQGAFDPLVLFSIPASIVGLCLAQSLMSRQRTLHALLLPLYIATIVDLYLVVQYGMRLSSSTLAIMLENLGYAREYVQSHAVAVVVPLVVVIVGWALLLYALRDVRTQVPMRTKLLLLAVQCALYGGVAAKQAYASGFVDAGVLDTISHDRAAPFGVISQAYITYRMHEETEHAREAAQGFRFGARRAAGDPGRREIYVLVIGESSRPDRWGLFGYERDTTPWLSSESRIVSFHDVVTQAALTQISVPLLITRATIDDYQQFTGERSLVSAYREAGFTTIWLSTQQRDQWTGAINRYVGEAEIQRYYERHHDDVLVEALAKLLDDRARTGDKVFAVLHTQGSHYTFEDRYPSQFASYSKTPDASRRKRINDAYDDTIRYTDHVLRELANVLSRHAERTAFFYVADHGENLLDDERELFGHFLGNEYDLPVPMVLWTSDDYAAAHADRLRAARSHAEKRLSTNVVFHTVLDLGDVTFQDPRFATHSLLRTSFHEHPRRFISKWRVHDYDRTHLASPSGE